MFSSPQIKIVSFLAALVIASTSALCAAQRDRIPGAPTYYIAAEVTECNLNHIHVRGATNLPASAVLSVVVGEGLARGSGALKRTSNVSMTAVSEDGHFESEVEALPGERFKSFRLVAFVTFQPDVTKQPQSVLNIVGRKGEKLNVLGNPQGFQTSGWWYGLEEVALVGECFNFH